MNFRHCFALLSIAVVGCGDNLDVEQEPGLDEELRALLASEGVTELDVGEPPAQALVDLGQALFFDRELSGNRDIACATCHHPTEGTGDGLSLSIGVGGDGLGADRELGAGKGFIPRNAPEIWSRGAPEWRTMFWDGRVATVTYGGTPAGELLPALLVDAPLGAQAMFPPTSRDEMRGEDGDLDVNGDPNELATIADDDLAGIWGAITARLLALPGYQSLLAAAYPDVAPGDFGLEHAALAIAAFEADAFTFTQSPFDRYLAGDDGAMSEAAKRGALLFYGSAGCATCHSGNLLTNQEFHNICAPQVGPGKGDDAPEDRGRFNETGDTADMYRFRTPALRNTTLSGPWMHDGAYTTLEGAVRHHFDPVGALESYDKSQLDPRLRDQVVEDPGVIAAMTAAPDPDLGPALETADLADLMAFLEALTDPAARDLSDIIPASVPSGLPVD